MKQALNSSNNHTNACRQSLKLAMGSEDDPAASASDQQLDFLWLELTRKCNLQCIHCYADSSPTIPLYQNLRSNDWAVLIDEAAELGCRKVQFIGGEPTLYPELPSLIRRAQKRRFDFIEIYTNGTMLRHELKQTLLDCNVALAFSIYASDPLVHDAVTLHHGSHGRTISNLKWALSSGLRVRVGVICTRINNQVAASTLRFLEGLGVSSISFDRERGIGRGKQMQQSFDPASELCGRCWQGRLCITAQGEAFPCVFSRSYPVGSVKLGLASILHGTALEKFRQMMRMKLVADRQVGHIVDGVSAQCGPLTPDCLPLGRPCSPDEFHPCLPEGGRPCVPQGGACTPESPPCGPEGGCGPNAPPV
jgi:MoaA/NifB/PqqE/SkfB family radical SAM enzyme